MKKCVSDLPSEKKARPSAALLAAKQNMKLRAGKAISCETVIKDDYANAQAAAGLIQRGTGIVYDRRMVDHYCLWDSHYPECPERLTSVLNRCTELGLIERCVSIQPREASELEILRKHTQEQIDILKRTQTQDDNDILEELSSNYDAIYINKSSYNLSLLCVGSCIDLVDAICEGNIQNGMAIIRPPGHHAMKEEFNGYCFFNNVALAVAHALEVRNMKRILIVDWDVHHGQGTQRMFYDDPRVVYFSIHRYEHGKFWPELRESNFQYIGDKKGVGYNFNVPLNNIGMMDADYLAIFQQLLLPMAYEFQPELVLVSAGYDAALGCPEGEMEISPACYAHLLSPLLGLANGKVAVILEGGYCLKSLAEGAALTLRCLLGDAVPSLLNLGAPCDSICDTILNVIYAHKPYWNCYQLQDTYYVDNENNRKTRKRSNELATFSDSQRHIPTILYLGNEMKPNKYLTRNCYPVQSEDFLLRINQKLDFLRLNTKLLTPEHRVALVYDERMAEHRNLTENNHPEKPERVVEIYAKHEEYGLVKRCLRLEARKVSEEELLLVHTQQHLDEMKQTSLMETEELVKKGNDFDSIYFHPKSFECALLAAGSLLQVVDSVVHGQSRSGVAIVRPPGHHAEDDHPCGFCFFNNASLAAKYAVEVHSLKRVLLLDWDVHHGNGSQRMFESDERVMYISLHRYNNGRFFPSSTDADYDKVGVGRGEGYNVNIPWNKSGGGLTDGDYIGAFHAVVMPIAYQFNPELVIVSAGFDACVNDPLGHCKVSPEAYAHMTHWLTSLANGRVILSLEGGYNVTSISYAMTLCTKALLGDPLPLLTGTNTPCSNALDSIKNVIKTHEKYWSCLKLNKTLPKEKNCYKSEEEHEGFLTKSEKDRVNDELSFLSEKLKDLDVSKEEKNETIAKVVNDPPNDTGDKKFAGEPGRGRSRPGGSAGSPAGANPRTLEDFLRENIRGLVSEEMFAVVPLRTCPHVDLVQPVPDRGIDISTPCTVCTSTEENWVCLICYGVFCGRYIGQHMAAHGAEMEHPLTLSFTDLSVWCYPCGAYVDNSNFYQAKNAVHQAKFGAEMPWSYGETTSSV